MTPAPQQYSSVQQDILTTPTSSGKRIVISGMSGLYPASRNIKEFSEMLYNKVNPVTEAALRFTYNHPEVPQYSGSVPGLNQFDAQFFKVHYRLGNSMDPMARKILEQSYQAIYDAGINPEQLSGKKVGVYIGTCFSETEKACFYEAASRSGFGIAGCSKTMFANRISYWLNAKGPSMSIDEACCSSTAALEQAYLAMSRGDCEAAIVGGAYLCLHPQSSVHYGRIMKLCHDGKNKSFDENADGSAKSEAINVLFLQKAKDALRIYADVLHVKSEFICMLPGETGPKYGFYRDVDKTTNFIKTFYDETRISANAVEYVEAFGCAVFEADKAELQAIEQVFCNSERDDPLFVGSVMSNIGYNEAASGISAITKVLLGYHTGQLAANLHCSSPRQDVAALREGRMRVVTDHQRFHRTYVAVNGMSITGVNSHVLLHGHYKPKDSKRYISSLPYLVTISARQESAVTFVLENLKSNPIDPEELRLLHNIHQTSISGHLGRGFIILKTNEEQKTVSLCEKAEYFDDARRPLWFVYSGMGSQWPAMGAQLMRIPIFAAAIERCRQVLEPIGLDIVHIITSPDETFDNILHSFVGIAAIQIGLTDILRELGLVPDGIIGHSVGELGCAYADGCLTAEEMILSAYSRGLVSLQTPFIRGSMAAVGLGYEQVSKLCPPEIEVACHNGPESSTISGPADVMREFVAELTAKGIFAKEVPCSNIAYHSRYIADAGPLLLKYLSEVIKNPKPRSERWLSSSVPQERWTELNAKLCSAEYHTNNLLSPVLFEETSRLVPNNAVLVEVAPHGLLQAILKRSLPSNCKNIAITRRKHPDNVLLLLEGIGTLFMEGYNPKVHVLYPKIELPVSTGTPFLSHLVEWAHGEKWPLPLYRSASRKTAANCDYVISLHDKENTYLEGYSVRGHTLYPFAASLVLAWDTLAMIMGVPKKKLSIVFSDVHLYGQPILHDQRQLRLSVALHRGTGRFEILNEDSKVATGYINTSNISTTEEHAILEEVETKLNGELNDEDIYCLLRDKDYSYRGEFRSILCANEFMNKAELKWCNNWVTFIDGLLQLNALRQPHTAFPMPSHIREISVDIKEHEKAIQKSVASHDTVLMKAEVLKLFDSTRCGGVTINNIKWEKLPLLNNKTMLVKALRFVPYFNSKIDVSSSLQVYLQIVSENVNKVNLNVVELINRPKKGSIFANINAIISDVPGVNVTYGEVTRESALKNQNNLVGSCDLVVVQNLSNDDKLRHLLQRILRRDQFVVSQEDLSFGGNSLPTSLFRVVSSHTIVSNHNSKQTELQLVRWGSSTTIATTAVTVRTHTDIALLTSTRRNLSTGHKLLVHAPYPPPPGLKERLNGWRKEDQRNKIHLIMTSKNANFATDGVPDDLAFNVFDKGIWGGEYFIPVKDCASKCNKVILESQQFSDYGSLMWVEAPDIVKPGVNVTVQYAAINYEDVKRVNGSIPDICEFKKNYGMDFSGITDNGERVMGLVAGGAASSVVRARPELLWPVPAHWSLEDAATVPLAYTHAFYCLVIKRNLQPAMSVMVHGGTGALGQATIALALAHGCQVYTTVSDIRKKHFLLKLYPGLKAENVGNSRNKSFRDLVITNTQGKGCDIVINSLKRDLREASIDCVGFQGICLDVSQYHNCDEDFVLGMANLSKEKAYASVDMSSIFKNTGDMTIIHKLLSEGISRGYVRPLSRVTYAPHDVTRAFRLLAASNHRGRVLLRMREQSKLAQTRLACDTDRSHLLFCNDKSFGLLLADRLVERGAKKLCIHIRNQSITYLQMKIRSWKKSGVQVSVFTDKLCEETDVTTLLNNVINHGPLEGVYASVSENDQDIQEAILKALDSVSRKLCPDIKYFVVLNIAGNAIGKEVCLRRVHKQLPATMVMLPELGLVSDADGALHRAAVEVTENSLRGKDTVVLGHSQHTQHNTLLQRISALSDITILENSKTATLKELGMGSHKIKLIYNFLRVHYNLVFDEKEIPFLTAVKIQKLENTILKSDVNDVKDLSIFFTYVDSDELLATTDMVFLPTLVNNALMRDDEFDVSQRYLFIVPGMEGHYERFRVLCERLKLPALVLQPSLDHPHETVLETAERYAETLLKKTGLKNNFYLLGYESGVCVALEIAAILEDHGLTGTVYCVGCGPEDFKTFLERVLSEFASEEQLQDAVIRKMFELMTCCEMTVTLEDSLRVESTWSQKLDTCVRALLGRVPHSAQYARALIEAALARIKRVREHVPRARALRSQLVLLRAADVPQAPDAPHALQRHSQRPVAVHQLRAALAHAARDLRCAAIVTAYLEPEILENFDKRNNCDTYLLDGGSFMSIQ